MAQQVFQTITRRALLPFIALALLLPLSACDSKVDQYQTLGGKTGNFAEFHGRWVLINYWAAWCKPCREEIPELNALQQQMNDQLVVLAVNFDQPGTEQLQQQSTQFGIEFTILQNDPAAVLGYPRPTVLPTTIVIDPHGIVRGTLVGPQTATGLNQWIEQHQ